jgi:hypothetical protein
VCGLLVFLDLEFWVIRGVRDFGRKSLYFFRTISVRDFYFLFFPRGFVEGFELLICCGVRDSWFLLCTAQLSESERARERERERAWILRVEKGRRWAKERESCSFTFIWSGTCSCTHDTSGRISVTSSSPSLSRMWKAPAGVCFLFLYYLCFLFPLDEQREL